MTAPAAGAPGDFLSQPSHSASGNGPRKVLRLADHALVSIIISVQFLFCVYSLLAMSWAFSYLGGAARPYLSLLWVAYFLAGIVVAVLLQKRGVWRRLAGLAWNAALAGYLMLEAGVSWRKPVGDSTRYLAIYGVFAAVYLAFTSAIGLFARDAGSGQSAI